MASMKFQNGTVDDVITLNKIIKKVKMEKCIIRYNNLGHPENWKLSLFSDAAFANLPDGVSSAIAYIVFLVTSQAVCHISWVSKKIRRVVKSTLAAEAIALQKGLEDSIIVSNSCGIDALCVIWTTIPVPLEISALLRYAGDTFF